MYLIKSIFHYQLHQKKSILTFFNQFIKLSKISLSPQYLFLSFPFLFSIVQIFENLYILAYINMRKTISHMHKHLFSQRDTLASLETKIEKLKKAIKENKKENQQIAMKMFYSLDKSYQRMVSHKCPFKIQLFTSNQNRAERRDMLGLSSPRITQRLDSLAFLKRNTCTDKVEKQFQIFIPIRKSKRKVIKNTLKNSFYLTQYQNKCQMQPSQFPKNDEHKIIERKTQTINNLEFCQTNLNKNSTCSSAIFRKTKNDKKIFIRRSYKQNPHICLTK